MRDRDDRDEGKKSDDVEMHDLWENAQNTVHFIEPLLANARVNANSSCGMLKTCQLP